VSKLVSAQEMIALEEAAFRRGVTAEGLMELAGAGIAAVVRQYFPSAGTCLVYAGKGNNGGDAFVAARHLAAAGWQVRQRLVFPSGERTELARKKEVESEIPTWNEMPGRFLRPLVILDGLLGVGSHGPMRDPIAAATQEINRLREEEFAFVFAIDVPTGLDATSGDVVEDAVRADCTVTIALPKLGLVRDEATDHVGRIAVVPLAGVEDIDDSSREELTTTASVRNLLPPRRFDAHKGDFGRIGVVAGSMGLTGAAILAAEGAVHAGAGLVSLYATEDIQPMIAANISPEVMVKPVRNYSEVLDTRRDVLAIGPGLGTHRKEEVLDLIRRCEQPMVIDADALNILSTSPEVLGTARAPRLFTPHPGEMKRLLPDASGSRNAVSKLFLERAEGTLLFKGSRTLVAERGRPCCYNSTGHPGMSTGGVGDVLTGVTAALLGSGLSCFDAARLGSWLIGRAAEIAMFERGESEQSFRATALLDALGAAFRQLRDGCY
jgi:hydroxyethylthiazole kinase-like uncharacterized protein yjeF